MTYISELKPRTNLSFSAFKGNNLLEKMLEVIPSSTIMPMFGDLGFFINDTFVGIYSEESLYFRKPKNDCSAIYSSHRRKKHPKYFCYALHDSELKDKYFVRLFFNLLETALLNEYEYSEKPLKNAANMKASIASALSKVDINSLSALTEIGSVTAYLRLKANSSRNTVPLSVLFKLEGAIRNVHATVLDPSVTEKLTRQVNTQYRPIA